jgi:hypothetical protein
MGVSLGPNGLARAAEFSPPVYIAQIILHKAHEPDSGVDLLDADGSAGKAVLRLIFLRYKHRRPQLVATTVLSWNGYGSTIAWLGSGRSLFRGGRPIRYGSLCVLVDDNAHAMPALVGCDLQVSFRRCPMLALVALIT